MDLILLPLGTDCSSFETRGQRVSTWTVSSHFSLSEGGMIRLETLIGLKFLDSSFSSFLIETRQAILYRAIRANSISVSSNYSPRLLLSTSHVHGSTAAFVRNSSTHPPTHPLQGHIYIYIYIIVQHSTM